MQPFAQQSGAFNAFWNIDPYSQETNFYRGHAASRQRLARQAAK